MHIADALLSPAVGAVFWAGTLGTIAYCSKKLKENLDEKMIPLMGVFGAFIFAAQMINFTIPATGSSGHLSGGMILAIILGPCASFIVMASVLTIQAFFFADGGILALGCNIWNLGFYPCFIAYPLIYKSIVKNTKSSKKIIIASVISAIISLEFGALSLVIQTALSGRSELSFGMFSIMMLPINLAIGLFEGVITAGVINYLRAAKPEIIESAAASSPLGAGISVKKVFAGFIVITIITGGFLSWFASRNPDGLEWSIQKIYGKSELPEQEQRIPRALKKIQDKTAFLRDINFRTPENSSAQKSSVKNSWPDVDSGKSLSGILGSIMVMCLVLILGLGIKIMRKKKRS